MSYVRVTEEVVTLPTWKKVTAVKKISITPMMSTPSAMKISRMAKAHRAEVGSSQSLWIRRRLQCEERTHRLMSLLGVHCDEIPMGSL
jgi:hypothetical protein